MSEFRNLRLDLEAPVATLTVHRPDRLNALDRDTIVELGEALARIREAADVRGAVITGSGDRAFVAGADISELAAMEPLEGVEVSRLGQRVFRELELSRKPIVAAVNGFALGGGCELALAAHLRIASTSARFGLPEVRLGIIPGYGGTVRLSRLVGKGRALELILGGEMIDAEEAHRIGLVNRVVPAESLLQEARELVGRIVKNGPLALGLAIESVNRGMEMSVDDALAFEAHLFGLLASTSDMREGMAAFLEKRSARFTGR
ncbi:MAG TPA: enoyl-CoA hydratase-related protein [Longimicrobiaceae bacterium]